MQGTWQDLNATNVFSCTVVEKGTGKICGFCQFRSIDTFTPEVGIDMRDGYMEKGYAQEAVKLLFAIEGKRNDYCYKKYGKNWR